MQSRLQFEIQNKTLLKMQKDFASAFVHLQLFQILINEYRFSLKGCHVQQANQ